jgi:amino acid transporter/nucleotide-binding universal stress UspA family protein
MDNFGGHRPRNVDWKRAAGLLYGDWGTSKAYVIGMAFVAAQFASLPIILAVCALTGVVGFNYIIICKHFPDGGGVYSAARDQSRVLAMLGALLLLADFIVTASLSCWDAMSYLGVPKEYIKAATLGFIVLIGFVNYFGPKHSGSFAISLAVPMVVVVLIILLLAVPHLTTANLEASHSQFSVNWVRFVDVILALSGVEAIANLTGVMKSDEGSAIDRPLVAKTARKAIVPVAIEVVFGTALLGWAMLSLPKSLTGDLNAHYADMMRFLGEQYGAMAFGPHFGSVLGIVIGITVGLLLLSAVNTAIAAMIGLIYMLAKDREMPAAFTRLNPHGVPWLPLLAAIIMPFILALISEDLDSMADKYAIGVVGAITVNLGSCAFNKKLNLSFWERSVMITTFAVLFGIEVTIAHTKHAALFFAVCVVGIGFALRWWEMKRSGLETITLKKEVAAAMKEEALDTLRGKLNSGQAIMVAARGLTPVLRFALEEARLRGGILYVLYVKELVVTMSGVMPGSSHGRWQDDASASEIMYPMLQLGKESNVQVVPLFAESDDTVETILDLSATLGIDILILGVTGRSAMVHLMKGNVVRQVVRNLPENIQLIIHG